MFLIFMLFLAVILVKTDTRLKLQGLNQICFNQTKIMQNDSYQNCGFNDLCDF